MRPDYSNYRNRSNYQNHGYKEDSTYVFTKAEVEKNCILCDRIDFNYRRYEVYKAYVAFSEDENQFKTRPIIVVRDNGDTVTCLKCTSKRYQHESYYDKCPIDAWAYAGFTKPSYIVLKSKIEISKKYIFKRLGKLLAEDIEKLHEVGL